jgi:oxygen-dependent protoporphyrinogen oxidase
LKIIIVGAGISGLATGHALLALHPELEIQIFESESRTGGKVWTDHTTGGYACEWGVNGFLNNKPKTLELASGLSLNAVEGSASANQRFILRKAKLNRLPETPISFLASSLISLAGKLRMGMEPFIGKSREQDESLAEFAKRRLGQEAFEVLIDPMASGVFAGDPSLMSLKSCFPRIHEIETEFGSLIRGMVRLQIKARREGKGKGPGPGPAGHLTSFTQGMSELTDTLSSRLGKRIRTNASVSHIEREANRYTVHLRGGESEEADIVVLASPAYAQAEILQYLAPDIALLLNGIKYPPLAVICTGYREQDLSRMPQGFGFLVPSSEKRGILGTIFDSNVFPNRSPQGSVLLRSMVGGSRAEENARLGDEELTNLVRGEFKSMLGINAEPELIRIYRHNRAIPQYHKGHAKRLEAIDQALEKHPRLILTGNAFKGVSLNDCIANAWQTAIHLLK